MQYGHCTGTKVEKAGSGSWYDAIQAEHLARIEAEQAKPVATPAHTEAPCSITVKFEVGGATPEEAVSKLQNTMAKTIVALGTPPPMTRFEKLGRLVTPPPMTRFEKLGRLVTCGLKKAADDPKLTERFLKAVQLVTLGQVSRDPHDDDTYVVTSQADPQTQYAVMPGRGLCQCPDRRRHEEDRQYKCKHMLAVLLTIKLDGLA